MGKESSRTEGWLFMMPWEKGACSFFSLVYAGNYVAFFVFLIFCLLPRYALYPLQEFKKAVSLEVILLVFYKYDCSHLIQLQLLGCVSVWFSFVLDSLCNLCSGIHSVVKVSSWFYFSRNTVVSLWTDVEAGWDAELVQWRDSAAVWV